MGWGGYGVAPVVDEGAEDAGGYAVVGGDVGVVGVAGDEVAGGDEAAGVDAVDLVEGVDAGRWCRHDEGRFGSGFRLDCGFGQVFSADLDEVGVAVEAEGLAAGGGDAEGSPGGFVEESDGGLADGFEAGEAVDDLGAELGFGGFVGLGGGEGDLDAVLLGDAGDAGRRGLRGRA